MWREVASLNQRSRELIKALIISNLVSIGFLLIRISATGSTDYFYMLWNLYLAWLPLAFVILLRLHLRNKPWLSWQGLLLTVLWLGFLPNTFYLATDLIHLRVSSQTNLLYDVTMLLSFTFNGFVAGVASVYMIHEKLLKRTKDITAHALIGLTILAASFAIYLGRYLRWNTWDVIVNPAGLLFDVTDRFINPGAHPQAFVTTATFFMLIGSVYLAVWQFVHAMRKD